MFIAKNRPNFSKGRKLDERMFFELEGGAVCCNIAKWVKVPG